jgi:hypothetical protein
MLANPFQSQKPAKYVRDAHLMVLRLSLIAPTGMRM